MGLDPGLCLLELGNVGVGDDRAAAGGGQGGGVVDLAAYGDFAALNLAAPQQFQAFLRQPLRVAVAEEPLLGQKRHRLPGRHADLKEAFGKAQDMAILVVPHGQAVIAVEHGDALDDVGQDIAQLLRALVQHPPRPLALVNPAQLGTDLQQRSQQHLVGLDSLGGKELQHRHHLRSHQHRTGETGLDADVVGQFSPREVGVLGDVDDPVRPAAGQHPAGQADIALESGALGDFPEGRKSLGIVEVPDPRRHQQVLVVRRQHVGVGDRPAVVGTDVGQSVAHGLGQFVGAVGVCRRALQQLDQFASLVQHLLRAPLPGEVAQNDQKKPFATQHELARGHFQGECFATLVLTFDRLWSAASGQVPADEIAINASVGLGNQEVDVATDQVPGGTAEHGFDRRIDRLDDSALVDRNDAVNGIAV